MRVFISKLRSVLLLMAILIVSVPFLLAVELRDKEVITLENRLNSQLQNYLATIIPANAFAISTTIRASERTVKEYINGPEEAPIRVFPGVNADEELIGNLPGLEDAPADVRQLAPQTTNAGPYTLVKRLEIDAVDVQLTIDNDVPAATQDAIRRSIDGKLNALYDGVATFTVLPAAIASDLDDLADGVGVQPVTEFNPTDVTPEGEVLVEGPLDKYSILFYSFLFLVGISLLALLLFLLLILTFRLLNRREQRLRYESTHGVNSGRSSFDEPKISFEQKQRERDLAKQRESDLAKERDLANRLASISKREEEMKANNQPMPDSGNNVLKADMKAAGVATAVKKKENISKPIALLRAEADFVEQLLREPLTGRKFFLEMEEDSKVKLVNSFSSNSFKRHFFKLDPNLQALIERNQYNVNEEELPEPGGEEGDEVADDEALVKEKAEMSDDDKIENLKNAITKLHQYRRLLDYQTKDPVGKLSLLTTQENILVLSSLPADVLVRLAPLVDSKVMEEFVKGISEQKKRELLGAMSINENSSDIGGGPNLTEMKLKLDARIDELARNLFVDRTRNDRVISNIFKGSVDAKGLLEEIKNKDAYLYEKFQRFGIGFSDMLSDSESPEFNRLVDDLDNNSLATIMVGLNEQDRNKFLAPLADARREVVEAMMFTKQGAIEKEDIEEARENFLTRYRDTKN